MAIMLYNLATFGPSYDADTADSLSLVSFYQYFFKSIQLVNGDTQYDVQLLFMSLLPSFFYSKSNMTLSKKKNIEHHIYNKKAFVYMKNV